MKKKLAAALLLSCAAVGTAIGAHSAVLEEGTLVLVKVLDRIIAKYGDNGYACLSASRGDKTDKENEDASRQLLSDIRAGP